MSDPLERLTNLLALLLHTREPLTLDQIAHSLAGQYPEDMAARRGAFERDKVVLRSEGIPVEQTVLRGDRAGAPAYWIDRAAYELDLQLTAEERHALQVAVATVHLGVAWGEEALWKLGGDGDDDTGAVAAALPSLPALPLLFEANSRRAPVTFGYRGEPRTLDPYGMLARDGFWYVMGRDHRSGEQRTVRVDRMEGEPTLGAPESFTVPPGFDPAAAVPDDPKLLGEGADEALVRIDATRAPALVRELGAASVRETEPDGSVVVRVPCVNRWAFRSWVLGLLDHAEVIGPPDVRAEVVAWLGAFA
jgi:predicted DNA-binding transcriptional regulator YafY